nr:LOW QUALITY PROTEIN: olfactory receptor 5AN6-like [Kogia breviceps]
MRRDFKTRAGGRNNTTVTKFILLGFSGSPKLKIVLFSVFLGTYLLTVAWNLGFIILIRMDSYIHTPMYFFLSSYLSFLDFCYVTSTTPKMLSDFFQKPKFISFMGCTMQYFFFASLGLTGCCILAAMAYDRYVAVCNPLLYTDSMSPTLCVHVVVGAYIVGFFGSLIQLCVLLQLNFCGPNGINHFCDLPQLLALSCSETFFLQVIKFVIGVIFGVTSVLIVIISYGYITATILKISSVEGRARAFNTCASHLTAVTFFFGSGLFVCMPPSTDNSLGYDKMASVFYTVVTPILNPLIYSLRNKEIKDTLKWCKKKRMFSHCHS